LDVPHPQAENLVFCATATLAWTALCRLLGGPVLLAPGASPVAAAIVSALDATAGRLFGAPPLVDETSCVARAGARTRAFLDDVRAEIARKLGDDVAASLLDAGEAPDLFVAYALLRKVLRFATPFATSRDLSFRGTPVRSFGNWFTEEAAHLLAPRAEQVTVHHYTGPEHFTLELATLTPDDRVIVARLPPGPTFAATVASALATLRVGAAPLDAEERLEIPAIRFDVLRRFDELYGCVLGNPGFTGRALGDFRQRIDFALDEAGAVLVSEAEIEELDLADEPPRRFVCDGPFLVALQRRGAPIPYLAAWIDNAELLVPA